VTTGSTRARNQRAGHPDAGAVFLFVREHDVDRLLIALNLRNEAAVAACQPSYSFALLERDLARLKIEDA
jgi:hypothetical protein